MSIADLRQDLLRPVKTYAWSPEMPLSGEAKTTYQRTYMREYMRRRRAQERAQRRKPSTGAGRPDINEGWQRVADAWRKEEAAKAKAPAPALRHCLLCHEPARGRPGISDGHGHFICRTCVIEAHRLLGQSEVGH